MKPAAPASAVPVQAPPRRRLRLARGAGLALAALACALLLAALPARYRQMAALDPAGLPPGWPAAAWQAALARANLSPDQYAAFALGTELLLAAAFLGAAAWLAWRCPHDPLALLAALSLLLAGLAGPALLPLPAGSPASAVPWLAASLPALAVVMLAGLLYAFPAGRLPRQAPALWAAWAVWLLAVVALDGTPWQPLVTLAGVAGLALSLLAPATRLRGAPPPAAQQIKWLLFGAVVAALGLLVLRLPLWLLPLARLPGLLGVLYTLAAAPLSALALLAWPAGLLLAVQRAALAQVDFAINRALVYGLTLAGLGGVFGLGLFLLASLLPSEPVLTFALAALLAGLLFRPARYRVQRWVDRRLYGIRIEYRGRPEPEEDETVAPSRVAGFNRLELIRQGGAGAAFRAQSPGQPRSVALKVLPARLSADHAFAARFQREMEAVAALQHPHLARVYEAGQSNGRLYVASEYCIGQDLGSFLLINGRLTVARALPLLQELAAALDFAHAHGQVHGDVRLANVMLVLREHEHLPRDARFPARAAFLPTTAFRTVLLNLGLARLLGTGLRGDGLSYRAPEQIRGGPVDGRTDIYALGALSYLLLAGLLPFPYSNPTALVIAHLRQAPPDPRARVPSLTPETAHALMRAIAKDPARRFQSAADFVAALK